MRLRTRLGVGAGCIAAGALVLSGCGGGGETTTVSAALTEGEFVSQANAVCKEGNDEIRALEISRSPDLKDLADFTSRTIPIVTDGYSKLAQITPPKSLQEPYVKWVLQGQTQVTLAQALVDAARAGDAAEVKALGDKLRIAEARSDGQASAMGLTECARDVEPQSG